MVTKQGIDVPTEVSQSSPVVPRRSTGKRWVRVVVGLLILLSFAVLLGLAMGNWATRREGVLCNRVEVRVLDSAKHDFVNRQMVAQWLVEQGFRLQGIPIHEVDVQSVERHLRSRDWVSGAEVYATFDGVVHVEIRQRHPLMRVVSDGGYNFYVDSLFTILPVQVGSVESVQVVTGEFDFGFRGDYYGSLDEKKDIKDVIFLKKLTNFAQEVWRDDFLRDLVVQVYVRKDQQLELIPRVGGHVIMFGDLCSPYNGRLIRLKAFYGQATGEPWFTEATVVDLRYERQVIVK